jgi:RNA polymerase sigma-70 factor (ECF subfamily)
MEERNDQQLISDYLNGDERALRLLFSRYLKTIYNFTYRFTGNIENAEDVTQETFLKVWKNLKKYDPEQNFKTWIFAIARNTALDLLRKKKDFVFSDFENEDGTNTIADSLTDAEPLPYELLLRAERTRELEKILNDVPPLYREVLLLHYYNEFTFDEISKILNKPLDTIKSQHRRGITILRKLLNN